MLAAPRAELAKLDLALYELLVFAGVIIAPLADGALQTDKIVGILGFGHGRKCTIKPGKRQIYPA